MLVLTRLVGEKIRISDNVTITVIGTKGKDGVSLGIDTPREIPVWREEIYQDILRKGERNVENRT